MAKHVKPSVEILQILRGYAARDNYKKVFKAVYYGQGITKKQAAEATGISENIVSNTLKDLSSRHVIVQENDCLYVRPEDMKRYLMEPNKVLKIFRVV